MESYELEAVLDGIDRRSRETWEQTRTIAYITAQVQSTKKLKPVDILPFPWDNEEIKKESYDKDEMQALREMILKKRNKNK